MHSHCEIQHFDWLDTVICSSTFPCTKLAFQDRLIESQIIHFG